MAAKTGRNVVLKVGGATIALLTEWTLEGEMDIAEGGDLNDEWVDTEPGLKRWRLTGRTNFNGSNAPLISLLDAQAATSRTVVLYKAAAVANSAAVMFKGSAWQIRGTIHGPQGMGDGEIVCVGHGDPTTVA